MSSDDSTYVQPRYRYVAHVEAGFRDFTSGLSQLNLAIALANQDMAARYARTVFGPMWGVIGVATMTAAMGLTFGVIFRQPLKEFLPYIAASLAIWNAIAGLIVEAPGTFYRQIGIISVYNLPLSLHVFRGVFDKLVMMLHALAVYAVLMAIFQINPLNVIWMFPGFLVIFILFGVGLGLTLGVWGARFRDLGPAASSLMLVIFLVTPIFWTKASISEHSWIASINPFYHLLEVGRGPLLGYAPTLENWLVASAVAVGTFLFGLFVFANGRRSVFYWM